MKEATLPDGLLSVSLFRKLALAWMLNRENSIACCGGILADNQGLGKTISVIALIQMQKYLLKLKPMDPNCVSKVEVLDLDDDDSTNNDTSSVVDGRDKQAGVSNEKKVCGSRAEQEFHSRKPQGGTLAVCPASVLQQWAHELDEKVADEAKLDVLIYHAGNRTNDPDELAKYDVVITTYSIVAKEVPTLIFSEYDDDDDDDEFGHKRKKRRKCIEGSLTKVNWLRVILDEAHTIKNCNTQVADLCCGLRAKKRWCLSGTPMQNSVDELFSYFRFLKCDPCSNYISFYNQIVNPITRSADVGFRKVIMLRRTKGDFLYLLASDLEI